RWSRPPPAPSAARPRRRSGRTSWALPEEYVLHVVEAGGPARCPDRGAHRAGGEGAAARGPVHQLDALALAEEEERVLADHVAAAHRLDPDLLRRPRAGDAPAPVARDVVEIAAGR